MTGLILMFLSAPVWAETSPPEKIPLTLEILQEKVQNPVNQEGFYLIDLQSFIIDLQPQNAEFSQEFYQQIQNALNQSENTVGLNLSNSIIKGDFTGSRIGVRVPLLQETLLSIFSPDELKILTSEDAQLSLRNQSPDNSAVTLPKITVIRGRFQSKNTEFQGNVDFKQAFFLRGLDAQEAIFNQQTTWTETRFNAIANFNKAVFQDKTLFNKTRFLSQAKFNKTNFKAFTNFDDSEFKDVSFNQAHFEDFANFPSILWDGEADFSESWSQGRVIFSKSRFTHSVSFQQAIFEESVDFRDTRFNDDLSLREASIQGVIDFSDAGFGRLTEINVSDLMFDSNSAQILGDPSIIGGVISVKTLQGNENLLRNLIQNFRQQEQIEDANKIEYLRANLLLKQFKRNIFGVDLNTASIYRLIYAGFTRDQADAIYQTRIKQPFRNLTEILKLDEIDLATYIKVYDRVVANRYQGDREEEVKIGWKTVIFDRYILPFFNSLDTALHWLELSVLLLLSGYGTRFELVAGVGIIAIAYFGLVFWFVDRVRRRHPTPILPTFSETIWMLTSYGLLTSLGLTQIFSVSSNPILTLLCLAVFIVPIPGILVGLLYYQGRHHNLLDSSYLTEDASQRQLRLMIGRLPLMPRFVFFRDRYMPILWDRGWCWLNYYDFSLNNFLKFGFNDLRLRDEHLPGIVASLVWYQWGLGVLYLILLFWTLSRTIPGLNLLIYLK
ncbi:MAG: pentapeptide repeat-containing protein [Lyngbya sp.]|nr:pentapeptide repeat-containing protein [Lyngbya sp.]